MIRIGVIAGSTRPGRKAGVQVVSWGRALRGLRHP